MDTLLWLIQTFGIAANQLADHFRVSPSLFHKASKGKRPLPKQAQRLFSDPLFQPYRVEEEMALLPARQWPDPNEAAYKKETEMRLLWLTEEIRKQSTQLENLTKRQQQLFALLHHTRHLPFSATGNETLPQLWWVVARGKAGLALDNLTHWVLRKKSLKITLLLTEKNILETWMEEDKSRAAR
jgi:hypothetical protein